MVVQLVWLILYTPKESYSFAENGILYVVTTHSPFVVGYYMLCVNALATQNDVQALETHAVQSMDLMGK